MWPGNSPPPVREPPSTLREVESAEALAALRPARTSVGSLHPLWAFAGPLPEPPPNLVFGVDGDPEALAVARRLASAFGAAAARIPAEHRLLYHLCATFAAGGTATVVATAADLARRLGLPVELGEGWRALATGAIANLSPPAPGRRAHRTHRPRRRRAGSA